MLKKVFKKLRDKLILNAVREIVHKEISVEIATAIRQLGEGQSGIATAIRQLGEGQSRIGTAICQLGDGQSRIGSAVAELEEKVSLLEKKMFIAEVQNHYRYVRESILARQAKGEKLRFVSYVVYDTTYGAHGIVELMLKQPEKYDVKFVICPDVYRDKDFTQYHKTKNYFIEKYGEEYVLDGYDEATGEFLDRSDECDVVYMANPYDVLVNRVHSVAYLSTKSVLPIFICYGYVVSKWFCSTIEASGEIYYFYKYFCETSFTKREIDDNYKMPVWNTVVSGYSKMDGLKKTKVITNKRKKILLAPHHTVKGLPGELQLSNFLQYFDFILTLPVLYPDVDFVFRPHPLLFTNLIMHGIWKEEEVENYLDKLRQQKIMYSAESEYFDVFTDCDAIVHDCGSFMVEWLYTGKPCCYVVDSERGVRNQLSSLANFALDNHTCIANSEKSICQFIECVLRGEYPVKISEEVRQKIMVNYPNASSFVLENLL